MAFTCPSGQLASYLASKGYNVWRYHFSGVYPNMAIFGTHPEQGACKSPPSPAAKKLMVPLDHTAEIPMVFGTSGSGSTPAQIELSQLMQGIWSRMAEAPELGPGWPRVNESVLAEMGSADGRKLIQTIPFARIDRKCAHLGALAQKAGLAW
jgi:carboxylesterase type B